MLASRCQPLPNTWPASLPANHPQTSFAAKSGPAPAIQFSCSSLQLQFCCPFQDAPSLLPKQSVDFQNTPNHTQTISTRTYLNTKTQQSERRSTRTQVVPPLPSQAVLWSPCMLRACMHMPVLHRCTHVRHLLFPFLPCLVGWPFFHSTAPHPTPPRSPTNPMPAPAPPFSSSHFTVPATDSLPMRALPCLALPLVPCNLALHQDRKSVV